MRARLFEAGQVVAKIQNLSRTDRPHMVQADTFINASQKVAGCGTLEVVLLEFVHMIPTQGHKTFLTVAECVVEPLNIRSHFVLPCRIGNKIVNGIAGLLTRCVGQRNVVQNLLRNRTDAIGRDFVVEERQPESKVGIRDLLAILSDRAARVDRVWVINNDGDPHALAADHLSRKGLVEITAAFEGRR